MDLSLLAKLSFPEFEVHKFKRIVLLNHLYVSKLIIIYLVKWLKITGSMMMAFDSQTWKSFELLQAASIVNTDNMDQNKLSYREEIDQ